MLRDAWTIAIETLSWMDLRRLNERDALMRTVKQLNFSNSQAIRLAYGLVVETTRRRNLIDKFINSVIEPKKISEYNLGLQSFLRLYVYQTRVNKNWGTFNLQEAENIASIGRAILNWQTTREIEPYLGFILTKKVSSIFTKLSEPEKIGLKTFHPTWFVEYCINNFGQKEAMAFLEGSQHPPPTYMRINTLVSSEEITVQKLAEQDVVLEKIPKLQYIYRVVSTKQPLTSLSSYKDGEFYVQDKASCFAAQVSNPLPGKTVFDVCAAPGAKTTCMSQLMNNRGNIYSVDFSSKRMKTWKREMSRMRTKIAEPLIADVTLSLPLFEDADLIIIDPPCTSTGVFAKQPSAKWRLSPKSIANMAKVQLQMINNCAEKVANGGTLVYSTCSITLEENEGVILQFLKDHQEFRVLDIEPKIGLPGLKGLTQCQRLYPHIHQCNGFFISKLQKT